MLNFILQSQKSKLSNDILFLVNIQIFILSMFLFLTKKMYILVVCHHCITVHYDNRLHILRFTWRVEIMTSSENGQKAKCCRRTREKKKGIFNYLRKRKWNLWLLFGPLLWLFWDIPCFVHIQKMKFAFY